MPAPQPNPPTAGQQAPTLLPPALHPYPYQVAGHTTPDGAPGALGDGAGRFYKPLQAGVRGERERAFYEGVTRLAAPSSGDGDSHGDDHPAGPFTARAAPLLAALPRFHGVAAAGGPENTLFLVLEDVAAGYARPCLADIKVGARAWYPGASPADAAKWKAHDGVATQGVLGWKVCGMQVWRWRGEEEGEAGGGTGEAAPPSSPPAGQWWRPGKDWCRALTPATAPGALAAFAGGGGGTTSPAALFGGPAGLAAAVGRLATWAAGQTDVALHSASVLLLYEGDPAAAARAGPRPAVRLIDFAHSFITSGGGGGGGPAADGPGAAPPSPPLPPAATPHPALVGVPDANLAAGLAALAAALEAVAAAEGRGYRT